MIVCDKPKGNTGEQPHIHKSVVNEIVTEKEVDELFEAVGNFGNSMTYRERLSEAVLKKSKDYWIGSTMYHILLDFRLWDDELNKLTEKGNEYLKSIKP